MHYLLCRAEYLVPISGSNPNQRIKDGYVLSEKEHILEVGFYSPEIGRRILAKYGADLTIIRENAVSFPNDPIPQMRGILLPGFVKAHGHDHEQPIIGIAKDEPLTDWLDHAVNPFTGFLNDQTDLLTKHLGVSPHLATYRMARLVDLHYGITASMVHHCNYNKYHVEELAQANEAAGTTMIVAIGSQDRNYILPLLDTPKQAIDRLDAARILEKNCVSTTFCPGPDQLFSNSRSLLIPLKKWAREHNTLFHVHSAEEPNTTKWFSEKVEPGKTPVEYGYEIGILDENTVLAHQVNCGPKDIALLAKTKTKMVHNPLANTILGSGMPPIMDLLRAKVPIAISTDGSGSADNQNIIAAARLAAQYQKAFHQDASLLPSEQLLQMITTIPAQILRLNQGELSIGKQADWILLDHHRPNMTPTRLDNLIENILWAADGSEITTVCARGRIVKKAGKVLPFLDGTSPEEIMLAVQQLSELFAEYQKTAQELRGTGKRKES